MTSWSPQHFRNAAEAADRDPDVIQNALATADIIRSSNPALPPLFTLGHLAHLTGNEYYQLRSVVRRDEPDPYRLFRIRKRPSFDGEQRFRVITVPQPHLLKAQRWITQTILAKALPHQASVAFSKGNKLRDAAAVHCGCTWLIKLDVKNFFESISEISVYRVFRSLGYQPLISFEMARICTRLGGRTTRKRGARWKVHPVPREIESYEVYRHFGGPRMGHLPQGAPTSPMLANLAMRSFDTELDAIADRHGLRYTRYADDLTFSSKGEFTREQAGHIVGLAYESMGRVGLSPNATKARITPPGSRKIVLGLLVDGKEPRLPREFKENMRRHLYYLTREGVGPIAHARVRGFASTIGLRHHLEGLLSFAKQIEPDYAARCREIFGSVGWPL
ncbi:MAG: reverse transcriptase family protein [Pseudomonadota bacterium]